jgi:galactokinase
VTIETGFRDQLARVGLDDEAARAKARCFVRLLDALPSGQSSGDVRGWFVPGRIELLGKHTDYAGGRSLLCTIDRGICLLACARPDDRIRIVDVLQPPAFETNLSSRSMPAERDWFIYPSTVVKRVARNFPSITRGLDAAFESDLPRAAGLSSSSALITSIFLALADVHGLENTDAWRSELGSREMVAGYAAAIENGQSFGSLRGDAGVGTSGGSGDHTAILCSQPGSLVQYAFCPVRAEGQVPVPADLALAIGVSGVVAQKTANAKAQYNHAARLARRVLEVCNRYTGQSFRSLGAAVQRMGEPRIRELLGQASDLEFGREELQNRFEHFFEESEQLVPAAAMQLRSADLAAFGATVARSHDLADELLRNQVRETTALVTFARQSGAVAASAFGAGFGGSVWAMVSREQSGDFLEEWGRRYRTAFPDRSEAAVFFTTRPGPAAFRVGRTYDENERQR